MKCSHEFKPSQIAVGTFSNGSSYDPNDWARGEGIGLDASKVRLIPCEKCSKCGFTWVDEDTYIGR